MGGIFISLSYSFLLAKTEVVLVLFVSLNTQVSSFLASVSYFFIKKHLKGSVYILIHLHLYILIYLLLLLAFLVTAHYPKVANLF